MWRPAWQAFEFGLQKPGKNRRGEDITIADWKLDVSGDWEILGPSEFCLSSKDFLPERKDEHAYAFYDSLKSDPPTVEKVEVRRDYSLKISMSKGFVLEVAAPKRRDHEWWFLTEEYSLEVDRGKPTWCEV